MTLLAGELGWPAWQTVSVEAWQGQDQACLDEPVAEEALIRTHVDNALAFVETLAGEAGFERGLALYLQALEVPEPLASVVMMRALVALGDQLPDARPLGLPEPALREGGHREPEPLTEPLRERVLLPSLRSASRRAS